jgi:hypothetical protein
MKTSIISSAAASQQIKADRPQQVKSLTVYFRGRKMVLIGGQLTMAITTT